MALSEKRSGFQKKHQLKDQGRNNWQPGVVMCPVISSNHNRIVRLVEHFPAKVHQRMIEKHAWFGERNGYRMWLTMVMRPYPACGRLMMCPRDDSPDPGRHRISLHLTEVNFSSS